LEDKRITSIRRAELESDRKYYSRSMVDRTKNASSYESKENILR
jgi:hypothetical protein